MHGGVKVYHGAASAARAYLESDRSRVDDYYLAEGSGLARRFGASPDGGVANTGVLDGDGYERWVAGYDPVTGVARGRLLKSDRAVRFVEVTVNGPKTWSIATALHPEVAAAYDAAQDRAAEQIIAWVSQHATTRVGPRGRQVQVPVEKIEAVTVRHYTSRAGDPHRHLHLQLNARVFAQGQWRGLHTVGVRDSIEALNGIGHAAVMTDPEFRAALASVGFTMDPATGEIAELSPYVGEFSERATQIGRNIDRYEAEWRRANPGQEPGLSIRQSWDRRGWKDARPDKIVAADGAQIVAHWNQQLYDLGYRDPVAQGAIQPGLPILIGTPRVGDLDRDAAVETVLTRLGARRSAWNGADIRGEVERWIAASGLVADAAVRQELAEDVTARALGACVRLIAGTDVPEHVRSLTSQRVLAVEADVVAMLAVRADVPATRTEIAELLADGLDVAQRSAVAVMAGDARLLVVEGAAGAGKTTTLAAVETALTGQRRRMLVVTPTRKAAQVAAREVGRSGSAAWLVHQHGFRWDEDGRWTRTADAVPSVEAVLERGDLLVVDEAGMLNQDTALALLTVADEMGARVAFMGDRHQLPAVGRGGVLDLAARWAPVDALVDLDVAHRFADPEYAAISLALRIGSPTYTLPESVGSEAAGPNVEVTPADSPDPSSRCEPRGQGVGEVWDALWRRGQICVYPSEAERTQALAQQAVEAITAPGPRSRNRRGLLMIADTREEVTALNGAIRDRLLAAGKVDDTHSLVTQSGQRIGVGDRVATRRNDHDLAVSNRETWTVAAVGEDGSLTLRGDRPTDVRALPSSYVRQHVELGYATTVYGVQGETAGTGHLLLGEHTSAASAYVGMTRGRKDNVVHIVAENPDDARQQWDDTFARDRADLGPAVAARRAVEDIERYGTQPPAHPLQTVLVELSAAWTGQADLHERQQRLVAEREALEQVAAIRTRYEPAVERLHAAQVTARGQWLAARQAVADLDTSIAAETANLRDLVWRAWRDDVAQAQRAAEVVRDGAGRLGQRRRQVREGLRELAAFADKWRPVHPDLAGVPDQLASQVGLLHGRRIEDQTETYIAQQIRATRPDADQSKQTERDTYAAYEQARDAASRLDAHISDELRHHGRAAFLTDLDEIGKRLASVAHHSQQVSRDLDAVLARLGRLQQEPAIRSLPAGALDGAHDQWTADRELAKGEPRRVDVHEVKVRERLRREARELDFGHPSTRQPDHERGIGR